MTDTFISAQVATSWVEGVPKQGLPQGILQAGYLTCWYPKFIDDFYDTCGMIKFGCHEPPPEKDTDGTSVIEISVTQEALTMIQNDPAYAGKVTVIANA